MEMIRFSNRKGTCNDETVWVHACGCACFPYNIYLRWETDWPPVARQSYFPQLKLQTELADSAPLTSPLQSPSEPYGLYPPDQGCWLGRWMSGSEGSHYLKRVRINNYNRRLINSSHARRTHTSQSTPLILTTMSLANITWTIAMIWEMQTKKSPGFRLLTWGCYCW